MQCFVGLDPNFRGLADLFVGRVNGSRCRFLADWTGRDVGHRRIEGVEQKEVSLRPHSYQIPSQPGLIAALRALDQTFPYRFHGLAPMSAGLIGAGSSSPKLRHHVLCPKYWQARAVH